jgi:hypothetical protein
MHNTADKPTTLNDVVHIHNQIAHRVEAELPSHLSEASLARLPPGSVPKKLAQHGDLGHRGAWMVGKT